MAPLIVEEALLDIPKEQSPHLMIEGVLGEHAPEMEITEAQGNVKEEGSSSTSGKEDIEDEHATIED